MRKRAFRSGQEFATRRTFSILKALLPFVILFVASLNLHAQFPTGNPTGYVNDFAGVLSPAARQQLNALCAELDRKARIQLAIVTVKSLEGRPLEKFTLDLANKWGIGSKQANRGVMLFFAIQDRRSRIEVGSGLESLLSDQRAAGILREMASFLRTGDYDLAVQIGASAIARTLSNTIPSRGADQVYRSLVPDPGALPPRASQQNPAPGAALQAPAFLTHRFVWPALLFFLIGLTGAWAVAFSCAVFGLLFIFLGSAPDYSSGTSILLVCLVSLGAMIFGVTIAPSSWTWRGDKPQRWRRNSFGGFGGGGFGGRGASGSW